MEMKSIGLTSIFFLLIHSSLIFADWANIEITRGADRIEKVVLENSKIRVTYATSLNGWAHRSPICITEFYDKSINKELVENGRFDDMLDPFEGGDHTKPIQYRAKLLGATLIHDGVDKKTLRLTWQNSSEEVSLFRNSSVLQIDYLKWYVLMTDWPGWRKDNLAYQEQMFSVYGADSWHRTYDPTDNTRTPGIGYNKMYYNRKPSDATKQGGMDRADGGSLNYNNFFIFGAYKLATGYGYGRIVPVDRTQVLILWSYRGWEMFPEGSGRYTTFLFPVTRGGDEVIETGKNLADGTIPGQTPLMIPIKQKNEDFNFKVYPNPFTSKTRIHLLLPDNLGMPWIGIYNLQGKLIRKFTDNLGARPVVWNGRDITGGSVPSGTYIGKIGIGKEVITKPIILTK
jgi:hypothetical protein